MKFRMKLGDISLTKFNWMFINEGMSQSIHILLSLLFQYENNTYAIFVYLN